MLTLGADAAPVEGRAQFLGGWRLCADLGNALGPLAIGGITAIATLGLATGGDGGGHVARIRLAGAVHTRKIARVSDELVWIDCEMTGLDLTADALVEVAVLVTDAELNVLGDGVDVVIKPSDEALAQMGDFVRTMHASSGLLDTAGRRH